MQEVGGSIPPGSTTLRPSGFAWRSRKMPEGRSVVPGVARRAKTGDFNHHHFTDTQGFRYLIGSGFAWRSHKMPEGRSVVPGVARRAKTG
jgi:hypothetical protein